MTANVLIVDDLEQNIKLLVAKLAHEYYNVFSANSGPKALEILAKNRIDVILLDIMMPGMDGFETCKKIKTNPETMHIPVVMVTALSDIENRVKCLEAGADELLTKPVNDTALIARVKSLARMKLVIDELKLRNKTGTELGESNIELKEDFSDSKILQINDDMLQSKNLNSILLKFFPKVRIINNLKTDDPKELQVIDDYQPDVIIISCKLEQADPLKISVVLKSRKKLQHSVFMLLAEEENIPMVIRGMELGINDYFMYPVEENELIARFKTQLRRKYYQDNLLTQLEKSVNLSIKDGLTNVFNRHYFDLHIRELAKKASQTTTPLSLLIFDIDDFKHVNDTYGHQTGDDILKTFTGILKQTFRVTDLITRYGGEEFAVLLNNTTLKEAEIIAERARAAIESTDFKSQDSTLKKTASIGAAGYLPNQSIEEFIRSADTALYEAKRTGKNKVVVAT